MASGFEHLLEEGVISEVLGMPDEQISQMIAAGILQPAEEATS